MRMYIPGAEILEELREHPGSTCAEISRRRGWNSRSIGAKLGWLRTELKLVYHIDGPGGKRWFAK
jgi:hypothetical protein